MKALVVYDSQYGNTEAIARAIAGAAPRGAARAVRVGDVKAADLKTVDVLAVGSPTLGGRPTPAIKAFLDGIPAGSLAKVRVAAFDTRMTMFIAKLFGWAADRIAAGLAGEGRPSRREAGGIHREGQGRPARGRRTGAGGRLGEGVPGLNGRQLRARCPRDLQRAAGPDASASAAMRRTNADTARRWMRTRSASSSSTGDSTV